MPVIPWLFLVLHLRLAQCIKTLFRAVASIGQALVQQLPDDLVVAFKALGLVERALVILETEPGHALENGIDGFRGGSLKVCILDAQYKFPAMLTRIEPGKQCSASTAHMKIAGGAGSEASADQSGGQNITPASKVVAR